MAYSNRLPWVLALIGFSLFLYVWGLGRIPFYTKGEPREALRVWEEVHTGDWILPMRSDLDLPSRPPLFHWLGGLSALAFGEVNEFSVRFPSAFLATLSVLLVFWLGAVKWGTAAGVFAAFILATNFEWMRAATTARVDMTLTALLIASFVALDRVVSAPAPTPRALTAFYLSMALATLGTGPVGFVLPALVAIVYLALRRDLGRLRQLHLATGALVGLAIVGSWYALAVARGGIAFVGKQRWVENVGRFFATSASGAGHEHPFYYMIGGFFLGFAPWSFFLIPLAIHLYVNRRRLERLAYLYPLVWFCAVFAFSSVSQSKRAVSLLSIYPAAALLLGAWWRSVASDPRSLSPTLLRASRAVAVGLAVALVLSIVLLLAAGFSAEPLAWLRPLLHEKGRANLSLLERLVRQRFTQFLLFVAALLPMIGIWLFSVRKKNWSLLFAALVAFVASGKAVIDVVLEPALAERRSFKPFMETVRAVVEPDDSLSFYRAFDHGALFYARRHVTPLHESFGDPPPNDRRAYVLLWKSTWDRLPPERRDRLQHLLTSAGTGPQGRDALVFALLKPPSDPIL
jgi:4-amino-4-deoxy-L-arabinose transferase-like glycosyltransferase